jgi:hypothetical protein
LVFHIYLHQTPERKFSGVHSNKKENATILSFKKETKLEGYAEDNHFFKKETKE